VRRKIEVVGSFLAFVLRLLSNRARTKNLSKVALEDYAFLFKASRTLGRNVLKMNLGASKDPSN
jgi:hypothetical protein